MSPVENLYASEAVVKECSDGLETGYVGYKRKVVPGEEKTTLQFINIPVGGFIVLLSEANGGTIEQRIESLEIGANHSSKGKKEFPLQFVNPGSRINLAGVSWKSA